MPINKRSAEYWQKRFEQLEDAQNNKGLQYFKDLERIYGKAISETEKDIAKWYQRYAREEGISLAEAKKQLSKGELKEFRMTVQEYIEKGQSLLDPAWKKELERASTKFHVTRLEALKLQMQQNVEYLMGNEADGIDKLMRDIFTDSYYHSAYEIHKGLGIGWDLMKLDNKVIDKAMSNPWTADGTNFSKRIWGKYRPELVKKLHDGLTLNLIQGKRADKLIDDITKQFNVKRHQAENLVQTEKAYFQSLAQKDSFKAMNVKEYEIVATLDTKTSDICREMDGKVFKLDDFAPGATAPPFHNRCRTATAPFFDDEFEEDVRRAARDEDGKYYTVPANMKYDDWYKAFVDGDESVLEKFRKVVHNKGVEEIVKDNVLKEPIESKEEHYNSLLTKLKELEVDYNPVYSRSGELTNDEVIAALSGGDQTSGSCASVALAYIGQKQGWNVIDYRGGKSQDFFSRGLNLFNLSKADGLKVLTAEGKASLTVGNRLLKQCEVGKEYYLCVGRHAAIVRKLDDGTLQYLELQSATKSGWTNFNGNARYTLKNRFGCSPSLSSYGDFMIDIDESDFGTDDFRSLLGYLNTAEDMQRKGQHGTIK